jgi:quercetin dioxygenase-like cupin family protein
METNIFDKGILYINRTCIDVDSLLWNEHSAFKGVFLKHIIKGENTDNRLSCHLVRINPGCEIGIHTLSGKTELHEIIHGSGICTIEQSKIDYHKGVIGFIPADRNHSVKAEQEGLFLLAKFFPALL